MSHSGLSKHQLRKDIKQRLESMSARDRSGKSRMICERLLCWDVFLAARTVLAYASLGGEVDTWDFLRKSLKLGKVTGLPKSDPSRKELVPVRVDSLESDLENGPYGILEPKYHNDKVLLLEDIDLVLVPALAFDRNNFRLGRGAGYYDRFLSKLPSSTVTVGLAFDCQIIDTLPEKSSFDLPVSLVMTN